jgi:hypothetical protein
MSKRQTKKQVVYKAPFDDESSVWGGSASYDIGELGQLDFDYDDELREKYPALKDAWDHYNNIKELCKSKEKENDENR